MRIGGIVPRRPAVEAAEQKPIWLAVVRPDLLEPLKPLANLRRRDGFDVVISTKNVGDALKEVSHRPEFLLLVGDDEPGKENASWYLPAKRMKLYRWRSVQQREYASDAAWGDLDKDGIPAISVGPDSGPHSCYEVELAVRKVVAFESQPPKPSDLNFAGLAGLSRIHCRCQRGGFPAWGGKYAPKPRDRLGWKPCFVCGNPNDPFCGWPPNQPSRFTRQMKQGGIMGVIDGHAVPRRRFSRCEFPRPAGLVHGGRRPCRVQSRKPARATVDISYLRVGQLRLRQRPESLQSRSCSSQAVR